MDNIIKLLAAFEETAYKILMLVIIVPKTLLKIIFDPLGARKYAEEQLDLVAKNKKLSENERVPAFADFFSPVLLLLVVALVPALLLAFLPSIGVAMTSSALADSSTQYVFTGKAVFSSLAEGNGYQFKWDVLNQDNQSVITPEIHTDTSAGRGGIQYDNNTATDTYNYDFSTEGNYSVTVTVLDQFGDELFSDSELVSVNRDSKDQTKLKATVKNNISGLQDKDLNLNQKTELTFKNFSDVLEKDTTIFLAFALLLPPLFFAFVYSLATRKPLNEQDMRKIFYVQCYYFSPLSVAIWAFYYSLFYLTGGSFQLSVSFWHFIPPLLALIWFVSVETNALADESEGDNITRLIAFFIVVACIIAITIVGLVISVSMANAGVRDGVRRFIIGIYLLISVGLIGIYFVNWRKARQLASAAKTTVVKDQKPPISQRLKWIVWSSVSLIVLCCIVSTIVANSAISQSAEPNSGSTPTSTSELSNDKLSDNQNWTMLVVGGDQGEIATPKYENDSVHLTLNPQPDQKPTAYYLYNADYSNVQIETSAKSINDSPHSVSLICGYKKESGWNEFEITNTGDYYIYQVNVEDSNINYNVLISGNSPLNSDSNIYAATCSDNNLSLSINNNLVNSVKAPNPTFAQGQVGVAVYSPESKKVDVQFSYVTITAPRLQPNLANLGATATSTSIPLNTFTDQFEGNLDRWEIQGDASQLKLPPENGKLHFQLSKNGDQVPFIDLTYKDSLYSDVQMDLVVINNGNDSNGIDLICRYGENGWYEFDVSSNGSYGIYAYDAKVGEYVTLASGSSPAIMPGLVQNTYTAKCKGNELTLLANGKAVTTISETKFNFSSGSIDFGVFSWDNNSPVDVFVDSVTITGVASQPNIPAPVTATAEPNSTRLPTETPLPQTQQFFTEEFDANNAINNWLSFVVNGDTLRRQDNAQGFSISNVNSAMTFDFAATNLWVYAIYNPVEYDNVRIDIQATNRGVNTNNVSLICRYTGTSWYEFNISNGGEVYIYYAEIQSGGKVSYEPLFAGGSAAVKYGHNTNEYTAVCDGNTLSLSINGKQVRDITEIKHNLTSGKVGVSVSSFDILPVTIDVDSVKISQP